MQTFLPYEDFDDCAKVLDYRRLGKQRVEAFQILKALDRDSGGWVNHPATKMWRGYKDALKAYMNAMISEWERRGYKNTMVYADVPENYELPRWMGSRIHATHRAALLAKNSEHYAKFDWAEQPQVDYFWPVS